MLICQIRSLIMAEYKIQEILKRLILYFWRDLFWPYGLGLLEVVFGKSPALITVLEVQYATGKLFQVWEKYSVLHG